MNPNDAINLIANLGGIGLMLVIVFVGIAELRSIRDEMRQQNNWLRAVIDHLIARINDADSRRGEGGQGTR